MALAVGGGDVGDDPGLLGADAVYRAMNIFFDTEFIEDGTTIDLLSIGMVREDGAELYCINGDANVQLASEWVKMHVLPQLDALKPEPRHTNAMIRASVFDFCIDVTEFWTYYGDYDWVALCQLFGPMIQKPGHWPCFAYDMRQWLNHKGLWTVRQPDEAPHHALLDARWTSETWRRYH
jgi:hypothetical protein